MKIAISSTGDNLDAQVSPIFGRCAYFVIADTETMDYQVHENQATSLAGGAGIQAAQFVIGQGAKAVLTGNVGPNAMSVFQAAGVPVYPVASGTLKQAIEAFKQGQTQSVSQATTAADTGKGLFGMPAGGSGSGMGMGRGRGGGGRGMGRGGGGGGRGGAR